MATFSNPWMTVDVDGDGQLTVKDKRGAVVVSDLAYHAQYGVVANNVADVPVGSTSIRVNSDEVGQFQVGDSIEIHSDAINNSLGVVAEITAIDGNVIHFSPPLKAFKEEAEYPSRTIRKVTHDITALHGVTVAEGENTIEVTGSTDVAQVTIAFSVTDDRPRIQVAVETQYTQDVKVFNEHLKLKFVDQPTAIIKRNRKVDFSPVAPRYWLDKQGVFFGSSERCVGVYHTPNVSSLELLTADNAMVVNLDDMRDHHYRWVRPASEGERRYRDRHASEYGPGGSRSNTFELWVGRDFPVVRFMASPRGYLSTYIWTEHADGAFMDSQRATVFGSETVTDIEQAVAGFAKHGIPMTKSVFYDAQGYNFVALKNHPDSQAFKTFLDQLHTAGFDICLHSVGHRTSLRPMNEEAIPFMKQAFDTAVWIDHQADHNREDISADGLTPPEDLGKTLEESAYCKDLWEQYGAKYFWTFASEDNRILAGVLDHFRPGDESLRTPLYWRHPTVTGQFYTWSTTRLMNRSWSAAWWNGELSTENLDRLVRNWGVSINHGYFAYKADSGIMTTNDAGELVIHPVFDGVLERMAGYKADKRINVTTVREAMDYWTAIEKVEIEYTEDGILVTNHSDAAIEGLSLAVSNLVDIKVDGATPHMRVDGGDVIFWFDIAPSESVSVTLETLTDEMLHRYAMRTRRHRGINDKLRGGIAV